MQRGQTSHRQTEGKPWRTVSNSTKISKLGSQWAVTFLKCDRDKCHHDGHQRLQKSKWGWSLFEKENRNLYHIIRNSYGKFWSFEHTSASPSNKIFTLTEKIMPINCSFSVWKLSYNYYTKALFLGLLQLSGPTGWKPPWDQSFLQYFCMLWYY